MLYFVLHYFFGWSFNVYIFGLFSTTTLYCVLFFLYQGRASFDGNGSVVECEKVFKTSGILSVHWDIIFINLMVQVLYLFHHYCIWLLALV